MKVMVDRQYPIGVDRLYEILTSKAFYETRYEWGKVDNYRFGAFEDTPKYAQTRCRPWHAVSCRKAPIY